MDLWYTRTVLFMQHRRHNKVVGGKQLLCWVQGMKTTSRRAFITQTGAFVAAAPFIARSAQSPGDRIVLGFIGPGGQGTNILQSYGGMKDVAIAAVCDVDKNRAEAAARESGIALDLSLQAMTYPTDAAHTLLRHAHAKGTQRALASAFFRSYFVEAKNIAEESVLADIAEQHGFSREEALELASAPAELELTREEALSAAQGGIRGVPFFVFDGRLAVSGAQSVGVLQAAIRKALERPHPSEAPSSG